MTGLPASGEHSPSMSRKLSAYHHKDRKIIYRHPGDLIRLSLCGIVFAGSAVLVRLGGVTDPETDLFYLLNHLSDAL
jgi:hypothetical protein